MSSHIQVELDALNNAHTVAVSAGIGPEKVVYGLNMMWAFCFRSKSQHVSKAQLRGFFGSDAVVGPLEDFGFVAVDGDRFRVKGTDRYKSISEKRSEAGKTGRAKQLAERATGHAEDTIASGQTRANAVLPASARAIAQHLPEGARANDSKNTVCPPVAGQKRALYPRSEKLLPTEEEASATHESPVTGPPQHAPGRGRAVAPPKPEPEPEPEWQPPPHCPAGHILASYEVRAGTCSCCARVERERVALEKQRAADALRERVRSIPMPPRPAESDYEPDSDDFLRALHAWALRKVDREKGVDWREAML